MAAEAPAAVPDFGALRACWHPVGYASGFAAEPRRVRLLGNDLVVWRDSAGTPRVLRSLPSKRMLQNGRKPPGHTHSSDWWLTRIGNASAATHRPSSPRSPRRAPAADQVGTTSPAATQGQRP